MRHTRRTVTENNKKKRRAAGTFGDPAMVVRFG
jgi:hypothetical protein